MTVSNQGAVNTEGALSKGIFVQNVGGDGTKGTGTMADSILPAAFVFEPASGGGLAQSFAKETGADSLNQVVSARTTDSLVSALGLRLTHPVEFRNATLIPEIGAAWQYDFDIDDRTITASFAGAPQESFSIEGQAVEQHGLRLEAGISLINKGGLSTSIRYVGEMREDHNAYGVMGEIRFEF